MQIVIQDVKYTPHYSTARNTGCVRIGEYSYLYNSKNDALIRIDHASELRIMRKKGKTFDDFLEYVKNQNPDIYKPILV